MTTAVPNAEPTPQDPNGVNIPPPNMQPGFVVPPGPPVVQEPAKATEPAPNALDAQVSALLAALKATQAPAAPEPVQGAVTTPGKLNDLDPAVIEDPILRSMATVMQTIGKDLDLDRVFSKALDHGDASLLDLAYLREKGGVNAPQLITIAEGIVQAVNAQADAVTAEVHNLAGGAQNWDAAVAAFNKQAPVEFRQVVAMMLDSKEKSKISAGAKLVVEFAKGSGLVPNVNKLVQNGGAAVPAALALTKEGFQAELRKLNPNDRDFGEQREALFSRRAMGRQLGQ